MNLLHRPVSAIATAPLVAVECGLALAAAPLFGRAAPWVVALFFAACAARLLMNRRGVRLPPLPLKVLLFGLGAAGIALTFGTALGVEPGLSILLLLVSLKLLETNTVRDFLVVALLGYFLALCDLFFSQAFLLWLYVAGTFAVVTAALVHFHRGKRARSFFRSARLGGAMLLQALPLVVLLFVFFPRSRQQFLIQFSQPLVGGGGMSDSLSPGSVSSLALGEALAFRAQFPDGRAPSMAARYWRGGVLWQGDGLEWHRGTRALADAGASALGGAPIRQRITLEPHGGRWLFALDEPDGPVPGAHLEPGGVLQSDRLVLKRTHYEVTSLPENRETVLPADQRAAATAKPSRISPHVQALVNLWRAAHADDSALVDAALHYFRHERFVYTLNAGTYNAASALDEFLFERRAGFCEHYAAAFATLMRVAGIPSRVVIGYHGGEFNTLGRYVIVRQSDAHAWCEVWIKGAGWQRVDPTDMIAPDRLTSGLESYLETHAPDAAAAGPSSAATGWREVRRELRLAWDNVNYQWDLRVLGFDEDNQHALFTRLGLETRLAWVDLGLGGTVVVALFLGAIGLWQRRSGRVPPDRAVQAYERFCRALAAAGLPREAWEGPQHFGERAAQRFAAHAEALREITSLYARLRYAPEPPRAEEFLRAVRALPKLPRGGRTAV